MGLLFLVFLYWVWHAHAQMNTQGDASPPRISDEDFTCDRRKGGLIGLAAAALGLAGEAER